MDFSVKVDLAPLEAALRDVPRLAEVAAARALNRVATTARAQASRAISAETGLKVNEVRDHLSLSPARTSSGGETVVTITVPPWAPNLIRFTARQTKAGVSANAWRTRKVYRGTFIANKGRTVFKRVGKARLPIEPVHGPSIPRQFIKGYAMDAIRNTMAERYGIEFERAMTSLLRGRKSASAPPP